MFVRTDHDQQKMELKSEWVYRFGGIDHTLRFKWALACPSAPIRPILWNLLATSAEVRCFWWCSEGDVIDVILNFCCGLENSWNMSKIVEISGNILYENIQKHKSVCFLVISVCFLCRYSPDGLLPLSICDARCSLRQCHAHDQLHHGNAIFLQHLGARTEMKNRRTVEP